MGQKTNPVGLRLGINRTWDSTWFDEKNYAEKLHEDIVIRNFIKSRLRTASVSKVEISRTPKRVVATIFTARPGIVIGKGGEEVENLKKDLRKMIHSKIQVNVNEVKRPGLVAELVGQNIGQQIQKKISFEGFSLITYC